MPSSQQDEDLKDRAWRAAQQLAQNQFYIQKRDALVNEIQLQKKTSFAFSYQLLINQFDYLQSDLFSSGWCWFSNPKRKDKGFRQGGSKNCQRRPRCAEVVSKLDLNEERVIKIVESQRTPVGSKFCRKSKNAD